MAISVELSEAAAQVSIDLMIELGLSVEAAGLKAAGLFDEVQSRAPEFTRMIYRDDAQKAVDDVALTLLVMSSRLMICARQSIKSSVWDAMTAINQALKHAREAEKARRDLEEVQSA